jgi:anhydro-N-acetylmuramic acid kinase
MEQLSELAGRKTLRVAGLMSGTSADGVDAAIVDVSPRGVKLLGFQTFPYPPGVRRAILDLCLPEAAAVQDISHLNFVLGEVFASAVARLSRRANVPLGSIDLIGSHGQTVWHDPRGKRFGRRRVRSTLQIGEPCVIAERTGVATVADFRTRDVAAGGQGAPLVPYADYVLFRHARLSRAVQNIGGIANVTYLPAGCDASGIVAFDTGPGNMVIDRVVSLVTRGRRRLDRAGRLARRGTVNAPLLAELMRHPFLRRRPPKSTGREEFGRPFADALYRDARGKGISPADILATVTALTAAGIAEAYRRFLPGAADEVLLCGGGARNRTLADRLRTRLHPARVKTTDEFGISADAKEAVSFAVLAAETIRGNAGNVPAATGAERAVVLGKVVVP